MASVTSAETRKAKSRLKVLSSSLDEVEAAIETLFSDGQTLPELLLVLEPLQQAKLQTVIPYLVYDMIFIYLRTKGIDPKSHPVITELERVRQYFDKIKKAEDPVARTTQVDKAAAERFIKHAISGVQFDTEAATEAGPSDSASIRVPVKVTSKMIERQEWHKGVDEAENEDEDLQGWEGGEGNLKPDLKGKGKAVTTSLVQEVEEPASKRRRSTVDPFTGYDNDSPPAKKRAVSPKPSSMMDPSSASSTAMPLAQAKKIGENQKAKNGRVAQLLAKVASSQGVNITVSNESDVEMVESRSMSSSASGTPVPSTGSKKRKKRKDKAKQNV